MSATQIIPTGLGLLLRAIIPMIIRDTHESTSQIIPIVFIQIFCPSLLAYSWRTIPGTQIIARSI